MTTVRIPLPGPLAWEEAIRQAYRGGHITIEEATEHLLDGEFRPSGLFNRDPTTAQED